SVTSTGAGRLLISAVATGVFDGGAEYTPPEGMTLQWHVPEPGFPPFTVAAATEFVGSGATGTRVWSYDAGPDPGLAVSVLIRPADAPEEKSASTTLSLATVVPGSSEKSVGVSGDLSLVTTAPGT